jgi:hypothetical protein
VLLFIHAIPKRQNKTILNAQTNKRSTQRSQTETVQTKLKWANAQEHQFANYANNVYLHYLFVHMPASASSDFAAWVSAPSEPKLGPRFLGGSCSGFVLSVCVCRLANVYTPMARFLSARCLLNLLEFNQCNVVTLVENYFAMLSPKQGRDRIARKLLSNCGSGARSLHSA